MPTPRSWPAGAATSQPSACRRAAPRRCPPAARGRFRPSLSSLPTPLRKNCSTSSGIAKAISRDARARTRPSKSSTTMVMWSRSTLRPMENHAVRVDDQLGGRLAASTAPASGLLDQLVGEQPLGDVGDGRRGEPGDRRQLGARDRAVDADGVQGDALIVIAGALEIGAREPHAPFPGGVAGAFAHREAAADDRCLLRGAWFRHPPRVPARPAVRTSCPGPAAR